MTLQISPMSAAELARIRRGGQVLESDTRGDKVVRLTSGRYLKFFRPRRLVNRDLLAFAAVRFARHARRLQRLGIPTLSVTSLHRIEGERMSVAIYEPLPGRSLRELLASGDIEIHDMYRVGVFIARLHRQGVYFRSLHPGNIVLNERHPGLIDVLDLRTRPWSLTRWARRRNWKHFLRCEQDRPYLHGPLIDELLIGYRDAADLSRRESWRVSAWVREAARASLS